jgi:hypothetical protein
MEDVKMSTLTKVALSISLVLSAFTFHVSAEEKIDPQVKITDLTDGKVNSEQINSFLARAKKESANVKSSQNNVIFNFTAIGEDVTLLFEETSSKKEIIIYPTKKETLIEKDLTSSRDKGKVTIASHGGGFIGDGVGARQRIIQSGGYLQARLKTAFSEEVYVPTSHADNAAYSYGGFKAGNYVADMGLMYDATLGPTDGEQGWKPVLIAKKYNSSTGNWDTLSTQIDGTYDEVRYKNGYIEGTEVTIYTWYNYNGKIRLKTYGKATCADRECIDTNDTMLIHIIETVDSYNISTSTLEYWKLLSTVVDKATDSGKNKAYYSNILIDNSAVSSGSFQTPEKDHAYVSRDSYNNLTILVDHTKY